MLQSSILTIEYQYTNVLKRVFTKVVFLLRKQHVTCKLRGHYTRNISKFEKEFAKIHKRVA